MVSNGGNDTPLSKPMREQVEKRTGQNVSEHLIDGGYVSFEVIDGAPTQNVVLFAPVPNRYDADETPDRYARQKNDTDAIADWRKRMKSDEAKEIYKQRASTSE